MKKSWLIVVLLHFLFTACNSDIFIKDFLPEVPQVSLNTGDSIIIPFADVKWDIEGVFLTAEMKGNVYDKDGNLMGQNLPLRDKYVKGLVKLFVGENKDFLSFRVERTNWKELKIVAGVNMNEQPTEIRIWVTGNTVRKEINLTLNPSEKYQVDHVEYHWNQFKNEKETSRIVEEMSFYNRSSNEMQWIFKPYSKVTRNMMVKSEDDNYMLSWYLGEIPPNVEVYDLINGKPQLNGAELPMDNYWHKMPSPFDINIADTVYVAPFTKQDVHVKVYFEKTSLPFTLHAYSKQLDRYKTFRGELCSSCPSRYEIVMGEPEKIEKK